MDDSLLEKRPVELEQVREPLVLRRQVTGILARRQGHEGGPARSPAVALESGSLVGLFVITAVSDEYPVARYLRDAKVFQIVEGNNQLHKALVAEAQLGMR